MHAFVKFVSEQISYIQPLRERHSSFIWLCTTTCRRKLSKKNDDHSRRDRDFKKDKNTTEGKDVESSIKTTGTA